MTVTYALLKDQAEARSAIEELQQMARRNSRLKIHVLEHGAHTDTIALHETSAIRGFTHGVLFGSLGAGALVVAMTLFGVFSGAVMPAALAAVGLGAFYGGLVGFLAGTAAPDENLQRLEAQLTDGAVLVSVACNNPGPFGEANQVLRRYGAVEAHPRLI